MRTLITALLLSAALHGQAPDVSTSGTFGATGSSTPVWVAAGSSAGMAGWRLTYSVDGTSITAAQMAIQGADAANAAGCSTASFATITTSGSSLVENVNPSTSATQGTVAVKAYFPCIRVTVTGITGSGGTITWTLQGWKRLFEFPVSAVVTPVGTQDVNEVGINGVAPAVNTGNANTGTQRVVIATDQPNLPVIGPAAVGAAATANPVLSAFRNSAGVIVPEYCTSRAAFSNPSTGSTQLVAVSGGTTIRVCSFVFTGDTITTMQLVTGTGSTCTSPTAETGIMSGPGGGLFGIALDFPSGALVTTAASTLCLSLSAGSTGGGYITYSQR